MTFCIVMHNGSDGFDAKFLMSKIQESGRPPSWKSVFACVLVMSVAIARQQMLKVMGHGQKSKWNCVAWVFAVAPNESCSVWWLANRDWDLNRSFRTFGDLNYTDLIQNTVIWFQIWFDFLRFGLKNLDRDISFISVACLTAQNGMQKSLKDFCFGCSLMVNLHCSNWLIDIVYAL